MPTTATLDPLLAGDASAILREELRQAAWIVLVGTANRLVLECLRGLTPPILIVEPDPGLLEERAEVAAAFGLEGIAFLEQLVGGDAKEASWYRYNDPRLNGVEPLSCLKTRYPNLSLESVEVRQQVSLVQLLQAWEPASVDGGVLVLPEQAGLDWLDGAVPCLRRLRALVWQWGESWPTPLQQQLDAVLADCWLVPEIDEGLPRLSPLVWRRDSALHFQATVLTQRDQLLKQVQLLEDSQVALVVERDGVMSERDALRNQVAVLEGEKASLVAERDEVMLERDALSNQVAVLEGRMATINNELDDLLALIDQHDIDNIGHDEAR